jgi:predicted RND superfamily exporter protein
MASCTERFGDKVEGFISGTFHALGSVVGFRPKETIMAALVLTILMGFGFTSWEVENPGEELWIPQDTTAEAETEMFQEYYKSNARISGMIVQGSEQGANVLTKAKLEEAMEVHDEIATHESIYEDEASTFTYLCVQAGRRFVCHARYIRQRLQAPGQQNFETMGL